MLMIPLRGMYSSKQNMSQKASLPSAVRAGKHKRNAKWRKQQWSKYVVPNRMHCNYDGAAVSKISSPGRSCYCAVHCNYRNDKHKVLFVWPQGNMYRIFSELRTLRLEN